MSRLLSRLTAAILFIGTFGCTYEVEEMETLTKLDTKAKWTLRTWSDHSNCSLNLDGLTELTLDDAISLGDWHPKYKTSKYGDDLRVWIYKQPDWVGSLFKHVIPTVTPWCSPSLSLNGVTELTSDQATELARWYGTSLKLNGVENFDLDHARAFAAAPHIQHLFLDGVTAMSDDAMAELTNFNGTSLFLAGVTSVSTASLTSLQGWNGENLVLGVEHLSIEQAQIIADMDVDFIGLPRLKSPSDDVILALLEKTKGHYLIGDKDALTAPQITMLLHWEFQHSSSRSSAVYLSPSSSIRNTMLCDQSRKEYVDCIDLSGPDFYLKDSMFMFATLF